MHHLLSFIKVAHVEAVTPPANGYLVRAGSYPLLTVGSNGFDIYGSDSRTILVKSGLPFR
jgi:hypothetical protein